MERCPLELRNPIAIKFSLLKIIKIIVFKIKVSFFVCNRLKFKLFNI